MKYLFRKLFTIINIFENNLTTLRFLILTQNCAGNLHIFGHIEIVYPQNLKVGNNCCFNHGCYINAFNPIVIGNDVTLSARVNIISTGIDVQNWINGQRNHIKNSGIFIGDHVWIGANAQILNNVCIKGPYVVVAAGSIVTKSIDEPYCLVAGIPAKIIKKYSSVPILYENN